MPASTSPSADTPSQARYLFERYTGSGAVDLLRSLPTQTPKVFETEWLDFKTGKFNPQDLLRIWSKALGAFANNEGGVVVWGIDARKDPTTDVDAAHAVELVPDVYKLTSRLKELHHQATDPPIKGVEVESVPLSKDSAEGFVVCYVPESRYKPHRAEHDGRKYYLRMGDSAKECSVSILRQLFYPKVSLRAEMQVEGIDIPHQLGRTTILNLGGHPSVAAQEEALRLSVRNTGAYSFHDPMLKISCGSAILSTFEYSIAREEYDEEFVNEDIDLTRVLHPGRVISRQFIVTIPVSDKSSLLEVMLFARDMMPLTSKIKLSTITQRPWKRHTNKLE